MNDLILEKYFNLHNFTNTDIILYIFLDVVAEQNIRRSDTKTLRWTLPIL